MSWRVFREWQGVSLLIAMLLLFAAFARGQNSNTPSPSAIGISTTGNVITLTGIGTNWTGSPFTLHGGCSASITAQSVSSTTAASVTLTAGTCFVINSLTATNTVATGDASTVCWWIR